VPTDDLTPAVRIVVHAADVGGALHQTERVPDLVACDLASLVRLGGHGEVVQSDVDLSMYQVPIGVDGVAGLPVQAVPRAVLGDLHAVHQAAVARTGTPVVDKDVGLVVPLGDRVVTGQFGKV
jgi:hypothetical protein